MKDELVKFYGLIRDTDTALTFDPEMRFAWIHLTSPFLEKLFDKHEEKDNG